MEVRKMDETITTKKWLELLNSFFEFIYLNLLWILFSLPIVTVWPASAAMYGVVRIWVKGEEVAVFSTYKKLFLENFYSSLLTGVIWFFGVSILFVDFYFVNQLSGGFEFIGLFIFGIITALFLMVSVFLFPVIVHVRTSLIGIWKNAFNLAILNPLISFINIGIVFTGLFLLSRFPFFVFGIGSIGAYFLYLLVNRIFKKWESK